MKKFLILTFICFSFFASFAQPTNPPIKVPSGSTSVIPTAPYIWPTRVFRLPVFNDTVTATLWLSGIDTPGIKIYNLADSTEYTRTPKTSGSGFYWKVSGGGGGSTVTATAPIIKTVNDLSLQYSTTSLKVSSSTLGARTIVRKLVSELRTLADGLIDTATVYKISYNGGFVNAGDDIFLYDPTDVTTADDTVMTIVTTGGKRLKRQTSQYGYTLNVKDFGAIGDWDADLHTGTDNTAAFRKVLRKLAGSKNIANFKILIPRGGYKITDTLATPNSAGWFTIQGEGMFTTQIIYDGVTSGKDVLTLLNCQHGTIRDIEFVGRTATNGVPKGLLNIRTDNTIVGFSGMVADVYLKDVMMRGSVGEYNYGVRWTCAPNFDANNEQTVIDHCYIELANIAALSNEMYNSLWHKVTNSRFSAFRTAIRNSKPNPGGSVDSSGGSMFMSGCTVMSISTTDTLFYWIGGSLTVYDGHSEGSGKVLLYARKSAENSPPYITFRDGSYTMGQAPNIYNIDMVGAFATFDNTVLAPDNLLRVKATDSTTFLKMYGCYNIDSLWYSSNVYLENPCYAGQYQQTATRTPTRIPLNSSGSFQRLNAISNARELIGTSGVIDVSGETIISLAPSSPVTVTNFTGRPQYNQFTLVTNGNITIANNSNISTGTGANLSLPNGGALTFTRSSTNTGGIWYISGGIGYGYNGLTTIVGGVKLGGTLAENTVFTNNGFDFRISDQLKLGNSATYSSASLAQLWKLSGNAELSFINSDNNTNYARNLFIKMRGLNNYTLTAGDIVGNITFNTIASISGVANSSAPGGFSGVDILFTTTENSGTVRNNAMRLTGNGNLILNGTAPVGSELFRNTGATRLESTITATNMPNATGSYTVLVHLTDSTVAQIAATSLVAPDTLANGSGGDTLLMNPSTKRYLVKAITAGTGITTTPSSDHLTISLNSGYITYGNYTPTLTSVANVAASTARECQYARIGNTVIVSGRVDIDPTSASTLTQLGISLPIASTLADAGKCSGTINTGAIVSSSGVILGDTVNNRGEIDFVTTSDVANRTWYFVFFYYVGT